MRNRCLVFQTPRVTPALVGMLGPWSPLGILSSSGRWEPSQCWYGNHSISHIWEEPDLPVSCCCGALAPDLARACRAWGGGGGAWALWPPFSRWGQAHWVTHTGVGASAQAPGSGVEEGAGSFINRGFLWLCTPTPCCCHLAGSSLGLCTHQPLKRGTLPLGRDGAGWQARGERGLKCLPRRREPSGPAEARLPGHRSQSGGMGGSSSLSACGQLL